MTAEAGSFVVGDDHPSLPGHFPGRPIVPGVVLLDEVMAVLGVVPAGFGMVRFSRPVRPGDVVVVEGGPGGASGGGSGSRFVARVGHEVVVQGTYTSAGT